MTFFQDIGDNEKSMVRRLVFKIGALLSLFLLVLVISFGATAWQQIRTLVKGDTKLAISVAGEGKIEAKPDIAKISASIVSENQNLKDAQDSNSQKSNVLVGYLKSVGVKEDDIKTVGYNIMPQYSYPQPCVYGPCPVTETKPPRITGYQITNSYEITVRDLSKAGDILTGIVASGANQVSDINFTIDKPDQLQAEARAKAIIDAKSKAEKLAHDLGRSLGPIVSFSEGGYQPPVYYAMESAAGKGGGGVATPSPSVSPGVNEIAVNVSITYEFR